MIFSIHKFQLRIVALMSIENTISSGKKKHFQTANTVFSSVVVSFIGV
jgi:hypothetical protein